MLPVVCTRTNMRLSCSYAFIRGSSGCLRVSSPLVATALHADVREMTWRKYFSSLRSKVAATSGASRPRLSRQRTKVLGAGSPTPPPSAGAARAVLTSADGRAGGPAAEMAAAAMPAVQHGGGVKHEECDPCTGGRSGWVLRGCACHVATGTRTGDQRDATGKR